MAQIKTFQCGMSRGYFVRDEKLIMVDTSCMENMDECKEVFKNLEIDPKEVSLIIITHEHIDHFVAGQLLKELTGAPLMCHKKAERTLRLGLLPDPPKETRLAPQKEKREVKPRDRNSRHVNVGVPVQPDILVDLSGRETFDLRAYGVSGRLIYTPGHSNGSMSLILDDGNAIVGDMIMCDHNGNYRQAFISDEVLLKQSVEWILENGAKFIYSGHAEPCDTAVIKEIYGIA